MLVPLLNILITFDSSQAEIFSDYSSEPERVHM